MTKEATDQGRNWLAFSSRDEFREWLALHCADEKECFVTVRRGRPTDDAVLWYIDAVEEALCFGWIDSVQKPVDGRLWQRFSPRRKGSPWTELNKERVRRLERLGLMTDAGRAVLPPMDVSGFSIDPEIEAALRKARAWTKFRKMPSLYQRVRAYNLASIKGRYREQFLRSLSHFVSETSKGRLYGEWNDYGRLLEY